MKRARPALPTLILLLFALVAPWGAGAARAEVKIGVSDWPGWVAWYVAERQGYFKKHGAKVRLVWFGNYTDSVAALSAGKLDANSQTWSDTMAPLAKGVPLKVILVNDNSAGNDALMASPAIRRIADLKGRKIALEQFTVSHFLLLTALQQNGMKPGDVEIINFPVGDAAAAFMSGKVEAAVVWNPWISQMQTSGKGVALFTSREMPGLIPDLLVARESGIREKRKEFLGVIRAWYDAEKFIREKPAEATTIMAKVVSMKPDEYRIFLPGTRFFDQAENLKAFGPASDPASLLGAAPRIAQFLVENKLLEGTVDFEKGIDASLVREVAAAK